MMLTSNINGRLWVQWLALAPHKVKGLAFKPASWLQLFCVRWVTSGCSNFLPPSRDMQVNW